MPRACRRRGSTTMLYCLTKPPTLATSATPSALASPKRIDQSCKRAQLGKRFLRAAHDILVDPADTGRVRPEAGRHAGGQPPRGSVQIFEHARARPIEVGAVLEDHIDEGDAEEGEAAHDARLRHGEHGGGERIGDLVLHHLRRLARIFGVDDDLHVGEVGDGVERNARDGIDAGDRHEDRRQGRPGRRCGPTSG